MRCSRTSWEIKDEWMKTNIPLILHHQTGWGWLRGFYFLLSLLFVLADTCQVFSLASSGSFPSCLGTSHRLGGHICLQSLSPGFLFILGMTAMVPANWVVTSLASMSIQMWFLPRLSWILLHKMGQPRWLKESHCTRSCWKFISCTLPTPWVECSGPPLEDCSTLPKGLLIPLSLSLSHSPSPLPSLSDRLWDNFL